jgi:hypothetical protein
MIPAALLLVAATVPGAAQDDADLKGKAGVCVRWGIDSKHVEEAVVVVSSGNPVLDQALPHTLTSMEWPSPASPPYKGEWVGIVIGVAGADSSGPLPKCDRLPGHVPAVPARNDS